MTNERPSTGDRLTVDFSLLVVRVIVGVIFAVHGAQKLFGVWGGKGALDYLTENYGFILGHLIAIGEFFGGLGLIVGLLCRFSAASLIVIMIGAIALVHGEHGFLLKTKDPGKAGFEYNLALIGLLVPILLVGPGRYAIGRFLPFTKSVTVLE